MKRFAAFWEQFQKEIGWADLPDRVEKFKKRRDLVFWLLAAIGWMVKDISWASWWPWLQPWSEVLLAAVVWFIAWKAATACYKTRDAVIWLSEFAIDNNYLMLELRIENRGSGEVFAHVYAQELRSRKGKIIQRIDPPGIEVHWRGQRVGEKLKLYGDRPGSFGLMHVVYFDTDTPVLHFPTPPMFDDPPGAFRSAPILPVAVPFRKQRPFQLTFRVEFYEVLIKDATEVEGKCLASKHVLLSIVPDAKKGLYRIHKRGHHPWWKYYSLPIVKQTQSWAE